MYQKELLLKVAIGLFAFLLALMGWQLRGMDSKKSRDDLYKDIHKEYLILKAKPSLTDEERIQLKGYISYLTGQNRFDEEPQQGRQFLTSSMSIPKK